MIQERSQFHDFLHVTVEPISARLERPSLERHGAEEKFGKISSGASKENIVQNHLNIACYSYFSISARLERPSLEMHGAEEEFGKISSGASKENIVQNHLNIACYTYFSI